MTKTKTMTMTFREHSQRSVLDTCDLRLDTWDTDYISDITILTFTLWPLNKEWWWQHSQFLRCFFLKPGFWQIGIFTKYHCFNAPKWPQIPQKWVNTTPFGSGHTLGTLNHGLGSLFCCFITLFGAGGSLDPRMHQNSKKFSKSHGLLIYFVPTWV